jgi:hypothetical protein
MPVLLGCISNLCIFYHVVNVVDTVVVAEVSCPHLVLLDASITMVGSLPYDLMVTYWFANGRLLTPLMFVVPVD